MNLRLGWKLLTKVMKFGPATGSCSYYIINVTLVQVRFVAGKLNAK